MDFIKQFLDTELIDLETYKTIYNFIALDNFRFGEYEGNQYIIRKINNIHIQIEDEVATKNTGIPRVVSYRRREILHILENYQDSI